MYTVIVLQAWQCKFLHTHILPRKCLPHNSYLISNLRRCLSSSGVPWSSRASPAQLHYPCHYHRSRLHFCSHSMPVPSRRRTGQNISNMSHQKTYISREGRRITPHHVTHLTTRPSTTFLQYNTPSIPDISQHVTSYYSASSNYPRIRPN